MQQVRQLSETEQVAFQAIAESWDSASAEILRSHFSHLTRHRLSTYTQSDLVQLFSLRSERRLNIQAQLQRERGSDTHSTVPEQARKVAVHNVVCSMFPVV